MTNEFLSLPVSGRSQGLPALLRNATNSWRFPGCNDLIPTLRRALDTFSPVLPPW